MRKIFINYRRAEAEYAAGALGRELRRYFGDDKVFRDKEDIAGGASWKQRVLDEIDRESALLLLIGKDWASITDAQGRRRLDNPSDPLRLEIAEALQEGAAILPILLENAEMPTESDLPEELRQISEHNALRLRDSDWSYDLGNICKTLERAGFKPIAAPVQTQSTVSAAKKGISVKGIVGAVTILLVLAAFGSDDLDREGHVGAAVLSCIAVVLGVLTWRESRHEATKARLLGIIVSTLGVFGFVAALGGIDSAPVSSNVAEPAANQPSSTTANVATTGNVAATGKVAQEAVARLAPEPAREEVMVPQPAPGSPISRSLREQRTNEEGGLRDVLPGVWQYQFNEAVEGGRLSGAATDQFFRNGASTSVGSISLATRTPDGIPFEMTWSFNATGEWSLDGRRLTEKTIDLKSFIAEVKVNAQPVNVAILQQQMNQLGQSLPSLESFLPRGMTTESDIVTATRTNMTLRTTNNMGGVTTTVYRRVTDR